MVNLFQAMTAHLTSRLNIAMVSDYLIKLMKLPITYFDRGGGPHENDRRYFAKSLRPRTNQSFFEQCTHQYFLFPAHAHCVWHRFVCLQH